MLKRVWWKGLMFDLGRDCFYLVDYVGGDWELNKGGLGEMMGCLW